MADLQELKKKSETDTCSKCGKEYYNPIGTNCCYECANPQDD